MSSRRKRRKARNIFISYSREGGQVHAVSLFQGLVQVLGEKAVFLDVGREAMEAGRSWKESVRETLGRCDTLLLVFDPGMTLRLADQESAVLFELETALKNGVTIACVRVDGAEVPASSVLPPLLRDLPEWHSPEVHSDAVVADLERVIKELTGRIPGQVPAVDRWDLAILGILAILGVGAWFSVGRDLLNLHETWLWGAAFAIPWLIWMAVRRVLPTGNRGRATQSYRQAASWLAVLLIFGAGLLSYGKNIYEKREFVDKNGGILVSRLEGDPSDYYQNELAENLIYSSKSGLPSNVDVLPRRIGFSSLFVPNKLDSGHTEANGYGQETRAAVVLWGKLLKPKEAMRLEINLTFIENETLFKRMGTKVVGMMNGSELNGLDSNLGHLTEILPRFLNSYSHYYAAKNDGGFEPLEEEFLQIIKDLKKGSVKDSSAHQVLKKAILPSIHFYRGNILLALGRRKEAISEYTEAVGLTADKGNQRYIEAASNLGWLLRLEGELDEAVKLLTGVDLHCKNGKQRACAYAWYNLGYALSDQGKHVKEASSNFRRAIERIRIHRSRQDNEDQRLEAYSYQNLAYSQVRHAAKSDANDKAQLLEEAQKNWELGKKTLTLAGLEVPEYFKITQGRIHIEQREWQKAIDLLTNLKVPQDRQASVNALLAGAYSCVENTDQAAKYLEALLDSGVSGSTSSGFQISKSEGMKEVGRIQKMCS